MLILIKILIVKMIIFKIKYKVSDFWTDSSPDVLKPKIFKV